MSVEKQLDDLSLRLDVRIKADAVYDAHSHRTPDEIEEQLWEHLGDEFPHTSLGLIEDVIEAVMASNTDPAPYCSYGHRSKATCDCGPIAENE